MKKIRVVQIGSSHAHALGAIKTLRDLSNVFEVVAVGEPDEEKRKTLAENPLYSGLYICSVEEALNISNLDAAVIETDERDLTKYAYMAAKKGLHIQMDKPGGEDAEEFRVLIDEIKKQNIVFQPGYMYRFNPAIKKAMKLVKDGALGEIFSVEAQMSIDNGGDFDSYLSKFKGGMMYFLGCHLIDIVYKICGKPKKAHPFNYSTGGAQSKIFGMTAYEYENGTSFVKTVGNEVNGFMRRQIVICGTKGTIEIKPIEEFIPEDTDYLVTSLRLSLKNEENHPNFDCSEIFRFPPYKRYDDMFLNFAALVNGNGRRWLSIDEELELFEFVIKSSE